MALFRCAPRSACRSKYKNSPRSSQEFLQTQNDAGRLSKNVSGWIGQGWKVSESRCSFSGLARHPGVWAWEGRRWLSCMASQKKLAGQADKHSDNRYLWRARLRHKRHRKAGENVCMCSLPSEIHKSFQLAAPFKNECATEDDNRLPRWKDGVTADSFRESFLSKTLRFPSIAYLAWTRSQATENPHSPRNVRA